MSRAIATVFRKKFSRTETLEKQIPEVGKAHNLEHDDHYIFYIVTKEASHRRPTHDALRISLVSLKEHLLRVEMNRLPIPKLVCGYDGLGSTVRNRIKKAFQDIDRNSDLHLQPLGTQ